MAGRRRGEGARLVWYSWSDVHEEGGRERCRNRLITTSCNYCQTFVVAQRGKQCRMFNCGETKPFLVVAVGGGGYVEPRWCLRLARAGLSWGPIPCPEYGGYMDPSFFLALAVCGAVLFVHLGIARGVRKMGRLELIAPLTGKELPRVSIIVPACNEAKTIAAGLRSLLAQDYSNLEIVVIDDRSSDGTGKVVEALQAEGAGLLLQRVNELPPGWLGKSHALQVGADLATGDFLLFTDADVILEASAVSRAMSHMRQGGLDHLPLIFANRGGTPLLDCLILELGLGMLFCFRPWRVREAASPFFMGVGAFNLIKRSAYQAIGGHHSFAMYPIDDVMLGKLVKERGLRQDCLLALEHVTVPWYATVAEMVQGLEKNAFAFLHYRLWLLLPLLLVVIVGNILPLWGAVFAARAVRGLWAAAVVIKLVTFAFGLRRQGRPLWYVPGGLITPYLTLFILLRSAWVVVRQGGIRWRERFYPLAQLKKSRTLF